MTVYWLSKSNCEEPYNRRKFRSEASDNMDGWKSRGRKSQRGEEKNRDSLCFFQWFVAPEGRKLGSLKRRVRSQLARGEMKKLHAVVARSTFPSQNVQSTSASDHFCKSLWREAHFQVKGVKYWPSRSTFGSADIDKVHVVVAWSTFRSQNVQNITFSDHFWKFRCRKSARCCSAKHISKSKRTTYNMFVPLLEVQMSKKCTSLWREAHSEVKMYKSTPHSAHFWKLRVRGWKSARCFSAKHISKSRV